MDVISIAIRMFSSDYINSWTNPNIYSGKVLRKLEYDPLAYITLLNWILSNVGAMMFG